MRRIVAVLLVFALAFSVFFAAAEGQRVQVRQGCAPFVRSIPSQEGDWLGSAQSENVYPLLDVSIDGGWYKISLPNGTVGWIASSMARIVGNTSDASSETNAVPAAKITYSFSSGEQDTLPWGETPYQLTDAPEDYFSKSKMPFWSNPSKCTEAEAGYVTRMRFLPDPCGAKGIQADTLYLFYAAQSNETDSSDGLSSARLYMGAFEFDEQMNDQLFQTLINQLVADYGKPTVKGISDSESVNLDAQPMPDSTRYYHWIWLCGDSTGIHLIAEEDGQSGQYTRVRLYIGNTDMDASLREVQLSNEATDPGL